MVVSEGVSLDETFAGGVRGASAILIAEMVVSGGLIDVNGRGSSGAEEVPMRITWFDLASLWRGVVLVAIRHERRIGHAKRWIGLDEVITGQKVGFRNVRPK